MLDFPRSVHKFVLFTCLFKASFRKGCEGGGAKVWVKILMGGGAGVWAELNFTMKFWGGEEGGQSSAPK